MIDEMVYGHAQAKKALRVMLKRSQERYYKKCVLGEEVVQDTLKCLLIGSSGTGKTHLVQSMSKLHKFPLITLDATYFTPVGNTGGVNPIQLKERIRNTASEYCKQPEYFSPEGVINQMVIFVDEFDKLGSSWESTGTWNSHVQANFLTLIEDKGEFSGISWIFAGAFSSLFAKTRSTYIGFPAQVEDKEKPKKIQDSDIIKTGILPELLGRISLVLQLDTFTKEDFKRVLVERLLPLYPTLESVDVDEMVENAYNSELGIRSLTRQLELLAIDQEWEATL